MAFPCIPLHFMTTCHHIHGRGVRVYPYPRVWVDVLRVGSGTGTKSTGRVYPFLPVKNTIFHDVGAISNVLYFFLLKILLTIKVETIAV